MNLLIKRKYLVKGISLFKEYRFKKFRNEKVIFDNQSLIILDDNTANVLPQDKSNFLKVNKEVDNDERLKLRERLIQGNSIEKTSITNYITNKM